MVILKVMFFVTIFVIVWAMIAYPLSIKLLGKILKRRKNFKDYSHQPTVTVMVVAHNEEKVILEKLKNLTKLNYPEKKIEFVIASDNSTDKTNVIVRRFIKDNPTMNMKLFEVKNRKGKTNAQNEAQKVVQTEFLVMTDANSMLDENAVLELMASFTSMEIAYVTGKLAIINSESSAVSEAESNYWEGNLNVREIESRIQTITAGNGAIYACRTKEYVDFNPIESHDSSMPIYYALQGKRAIANHDAIAYEKAGEVVEDEFKRKVRMNRVLLKHILPSFKILNFFKYRWFTYFYLGHRTCRYLLWISHLILLLTSLLLADDFILFALALLFQVAFYAIAIISHQSKLRNKYMTMVYYYTVTVLAQWMGVYRTITGKAKPFWEKAESTR